MSHRIRGLVAVLAVLAVAASVAEVMRRSRELERLLADERQALVAERAGHRLVDHVVHSEHVRTISDCERRLAEMAAAIGVSAAVSSVSPSQEGGHS